MIIFDNTFSFEVYIKTDQYGTFNQSTNVSTGLVEILSNGSADMGAVYIHLDSDRAKRIAVVPLMRDKSRFFTNQSPIESYSWTTFMKASNCHNLNLQTTLEYQIEDAHR